ncbi:hypothetical protein [Altericroceibacterium xinjiangense]|uniref:hypothetical protein n=1 Tax=Altericroceibacterium xinjiangense TaxID=762261 RepID=UPI000F7EDB14|nr:hypothetical protein [Altericroceibacterium xinjiangense]
MKIVKNVLGSIAIASLLAAQPVLAISERVREATPSADSEELATMGAMGAIGIGAVLLAAVALLEITEVVDILESNDAEPLSP